jgi:hypothetical protein
MIREQLNQSRLTRLTHQEEKEKRNMGAKRIHVKTKRTAEEKARIKKIRDEFQKKKPSMDDLLETGEYEGPIPLGIYMNLFEAVIALKRLREHLGLSLADVSKRSGMDRAFVCRLENGHQPNPTIDTFWRYAAALGKRPQIGFRDLQYEEKESVWVKSPGTPPRH